MHRYRNVVLTGFMGTGKSTVGRLLAAQLGFEFVDTDTIIEERHGPIAVIFAEQGESAFRAIEREVAAELGERDHLVVATGGRLMLDPANVHALSNNAAVFCLVASPDEILERVTADAARIERPLLAVDDPRQRIIDLLDEREAGYRCFTQILTSHRSPTDIAAELAAIVGAENS
ncbi:MAG: shikimate kinase [Acidimicrobiales bacterium]